MTENVRDELVHYGSDADLFVCCVLIVCMCLDLPCYNGSALEDEAVHLRGRFEVF